MLNYLGMMGYTLPDQREMFSLDELCETFDIKRVSLGGPVFGVEKLKWLNGRYLREKMSHDEVLQKLLKWKGGPDFFRKIIPLALPRLETFSDFFPISQFLLNEIPTYQFEDLIGKQESVEVARILKIAEWELGENRIWERDSLASLFQGIAETEEKKLKELLAPFFVCLTGSKVSLPLFDGMALLGADLTRTRIRKALQLLSRKRCRTEQERIKGSGKGISPKLRKPDRLSSTNSASSNQWNLQIKKKRTNRSISFAPASRRTRRAAKTTDACTHAFLRTKWIPSLGPCQEYLLELWHSQGIRRPLQPETGRHEPGRRKTEYAEAIQEDARWLGFDWEERFYHASDYFQQLYEWAPSLSKMGKPSFAT